MTPPTPPTSSPTPPLSSGAAPPQPDVFQHYQVLRRPDGTLWELGRGAMGITYKAFDVNLRCHVALKVVNAQYLHSETAKARFVREARAAARLRHPNVASVYHLGMDADSFFYAMEFIDGETLESLVRRLGPLAPATALRLMLQVARALIASSRQRLVHRDIKPANLMVVRDEDEEGDEHAQLRVKVIDFGLARSLFSTNATGVPPSSGGHGALSNVTLGGFVGTPLFASPEQLEEKDLDARSDFYSLGVTLWYLLAGQPPFTGTLASIISQHLTREPPLENLPTTVPECVRALLTRLLEKDAANRPQTGSELRADLEGCLRAVLAARAAQDGDAELDTIAEPDALFTVEAADLPASGRRSDGDAAFITGTILGNRFRIVRFVGEGSGGRVFLARDFQANNAPVAVRVLPSDLIATPAEEENFRADYERSKQAPHPALLNSQAFDRHGAHYYLAQEWVSGFTLVDLLRNRGTLAMDDALRVLHSAALATDHAAANGVSHRLDFAPHQVLLHFPGDRVNDGSDAPLRPVPMGPLSGWPEWRLKLNPLGAGRDASDIVTWAGDMTLLPEIEKLPTRDTHSSIEGWTPETGRLLPALGRLVYEMLGGGVTPGAGAVRFVNRPALSEEANAVLGRCVNGEDATFTNGAEFYETLARAAGFDPDTLRPFISAPPPLAVPPPVPATTEGAPEAIEDAPPRRSAGPAAGSDTDEASATLETMPPAAAAPTVIETRRVPAVAPAPAAKRTPRLRTPARKLSDTSLARTDRKEPERLAPLPARGATAAPPAAPRGAMDEESSDGSDSDPLGTEPSSSSSMDEWRDMLLGDTPERSRWLRVALIAAVLVFCAAGIFAWRQTRRPSAGAAVATTTPAAAASRQPNATVAAASSPAAATKPPPAPPVAITARPQSSPAVAATAVPSPTTAAAGASSPRAASAPSASSSPRASATDRIASVSASPARASASATPTPSAASPPVAAAPNPRSLAEEIAAKPTVTPSRLAAVPPPPPVLPEGAAPDSPGGRNTATTSVAPAASTTPSRPVEVAPIAPPPVPAPESVNVPAPTPAHMVAATTTTTTATAPVAKGSTNTTVVPPSPSPTAAPASSPPGGGTPATAAASQNTAAAFLASRQPSEPSSSPANAAPESTDTAASAPPSQPPAAAAEKRVAVHLTSDPSKAEITLRGESLGVTPKTVMLPPGEHELVAHYWNWPEVRQQIYLSPEDKTADVKVRLISPDQIPINRQTSAESPAATTSAKDKERTAKKEKEKAREREKKRNDTANAPAAIPVTPEELATPPPRRRGPFGLFGRQRPRDSQQPPANVPVLPAQPVSPPPPTRSNDVQPFFDGRTIEQQPGNTRTETDRPRG